MGLVPAIFRVAFTIINERNGGCAPGFFEKYQKMDLVGGVNNE
jgi:hypothetical protein